MDEPIEERRQQAIEQVTGDMSLTENLSDSQAEHMLSWATRSASWLAVQTAEMDEAEAAPYLEEKLAGLRKIIRRVNNLMGDLPDAAEDEVAEILEKVFRPVDDLPELGCQVPDDLDALATRLKEAEPDVALAFLLTILSGEITTL